MWEKKQKLNYHLKIGTFTLFNLKKTPNMSLNYKIIISIRIFAGIQVTVNTAYMYTYNFTEVHLLAENSFKNLILNLY